MTCDSFPAFSCSARSAGVIRPGEGSAKIIGLLSSQSGLAAIRSSLLHSISSVKLCSPGRLGSSGMLSGPVSALSSFSSSLSLEIKAFMRVLFLVGVSSNPSSLFFSGFRGGGVVPACTRSSGGRGDKTRAAGIGISSTLRLSSSAKATTELYRMRPTSEYSAIGSSATVMGAAPRRAERVSAFSSSAILGNRCVKLDVRLSGEVTL